MLRILMLMVGLIFFLYVASPSEACERVARGTWPVRALFDAVGVVLHHWSDDGQRLQLIVWGFQSDRMVKDFVGQTLYGHGFAQLCEAPPDIEARTAPTSSEPQP